MKRRIMNWFAVIFERLSLYLDQRAPTLHRIKAVKAVQVVHIHRPMARISHDRASVPHRCMPPSGLPWSGGSYYCQLCRTWRLYQPLTLPRPEATAPHFVPRIRGRHNGHLRYTGGLVVDTGKLMMPGRG